MTESLSNQMQPYLPGMGDDSELGQQIARAQRGKAPHEMTPEEFANHPYAVFHGTHREDAISARGESGSYAMHAGTKKAAYDRVAHLSHMAGMGFDDHLENEPRLHTMWAVPRMGELKRHETAGHYRFYDDDKYPFHEDEDLGRHPADSVGQPFRGVPKDELGYYENTVEDKDSISTVTRASNTRYKTQSDYVRDAISSGKAHEVHPVTMHLYKNGQLDGGEPMDLTKIQRNARPTGQMAFDLGPEHREGLTAVQLGGLKHAPSMVPIGFHNYDRANERGVQDKVALSETHVTEPDTEMGKLGPRISRIKRQFLQDKGRPGE